MARKSKDAATGPTLRLKAGEGRGAEGGGAMGAREAAGAGVAPTAGGGGIAPGAGGGGGTMGVAATGLASFSFGG